MGKTGLVLEGGAMRGIYTAGVLDYFIKEKIIFHYISAVSAGACQALSYISKQKGRNKNVIMDYITDPRYLSFGNLIKKGGVFGFDFMFEDIVDTLAPFDFHTFEKSAQELAIGATNCMTGKSDYFYKSKITTQELFLACIASCSMPLCAKRVFINNTPYLDGGIADSIAVGRAFLDGCDKVVVVLTRNEDYRKKYSHVMMLLAQSKYKQYPLFLEALSKRHIKYNKTIQYIEALESMGKAFVIRPQTKVQIKRLEKDKTKLLAFYKEGYLNAKQKQKELLQFIN